MLTITPTIFLLVELLRSFKDFKRICNWKRDYEEKKGEFDSSDDEGIAKASGKDKKEDIDLLKDQVTEDSLVEKEISLTDSEEELNQGGDNNGPNQTSQDRMEQEYLNNQADGGANDYG